MRGKDLPLVIAALEEQQRTGAVAVCVDLVDRRAREAARQRRYRARRRGALPDVADATKRDSYILGRASTYDELRRLLKDRRNQLGYSQAELDDRTGLPDRYVSKLEIGAQKKGGRNAGRLSMELWLQALGVQLVLVKL